MKKNTKLSLIAVFLLVTVFSCKDDEAIVEQPKASDVSTRSINNTDFTSDEYKHKSQSNVENMLMDQIIYRDSMYVLNMSKEEAKDLTIPDSLYNVYSKIVEDLNKAQ